MKIQRSISAIRCAIADRRFVSHASKANLSKYERQYYDKMVDISGPSVHSPIKVMKNFYSAYQHNIQRIKVTESYMNAFKEPSKVSRIFHRLFNK